MASSHKHNPSASPALPDSFAPWTPGKLCYQPEPVTLYREDGGHLRELPHLGPGAPRLCPAGGIVMDRCVSAAQHPLSLSW